MGEGKEVLDVFVTSVCSLTVLAFGCQSFVTFTTEAIFFFSFFWPLSELGVVYLHSSSFFPEKSWTLDSDFFISLAILVPRTTLSYCRHNARLLGLVQRIFYYTF